MVNLKKVLDKLDKDHKLMLILDGLTFKYMLSRAEKTKDEEFRIIFKKILRRTSVFAEMSAF